MSVTWTFSSLPQYSWDQQPLFYRDLSSFYYPTLEAKIDMVATKGSILHFLCCWLYIILICTSALCFLKFKKYHIVTKMHGWTLVCSWHWMTMVIMLSRHSFPFRDPGPKQMFLFVSKVYIAREFPGKIQAIKQTMTISWYYFPPSL